MGKKAANAGVRRSSTFTMRSGKKVEFGRLTFGDTIKCKDEALEQYKRRMLQTWTRNADMLPEDQRADLILQAFHRAEQLQVEDLPTREITNVERVDGKLVERKHVVPYTGWWLSETQEGWLYAAWLAGRNAGGDQAEWSFADAEELFDQQMDDLERAAQKIGDISDPQILKELGGEGNGRGNATTTVRDLCEAYDYTPEQVANMTLDEIYALSLDKKLLQKATGAAVTGTPTELADMGLRKKPAGKSRARELMEQQEAAQQSYRQLQMEMVSAGPRRRKKLRRRMDALKKEWDL